MYHRINLIFLPKKKKTIKINKNTHWTEKQNVLAQMHTKSKHRHTHDNVNVF